VLGLGIVMKEQMRHIYTVMIITIAIMLQACGGSGDKTVFSISADISEANFSNEFLQESTDVIAIQVNFEGDGLVVGFASGTAPLFAVEGKADPISWLNYRIENVTDNSATIFVTAQNVFEYIDDNNEAGESALLANTYTTTLRLATSNEDSSKFASHDIDVSFLVWNIVDTQKVKYSGTFGDTSIPSQTISILSETNEWTASADVDWLSLDVISGTGNDEIVVTADVSAFNASGLQQGNVTIIEPTSGITKVIPVELALDNVYLLAEHPTIALTSTNSISALEKVVTITSNSSLDVSWQASTEVNWLNVTTISDTELQITADPMIAPMNENSSAQVVISASQNSTVISETIKVNFYNSDQVVENNVLQALEINNNEMLVSPLTPTFYAGVGNQIIAYHQYTGEVEASIVVSPEGTVLEKLIMHPEGDYLLAKTVEIVINEDETTQEIPHRYRVNLLDSSITEILDADILNEPKDIVRLSGRYFVVTEALEFADENLQVLYWDRANAYFVSDIDVAAQADTLFALDNNATNKLASLKRYTPQVNDYGDDQIKMTLTHEYHPESLGEEQYIRDFIVTNDETNIYAISENSEWISFNSEAIEDEAFVDNGLLETNGNIVTFFLEKNNNSQPSYLRFDPSNPLGFYLDIYDSQQMITETVFTEGMQPTSIKLSSDDQRLIINVDSSNDPEVDSQVELVTISQ
jgi:hypothetical protein